MREEEVVDLTEAERATVRACLEQARTALAEARGVITWWSLRAQYQQITYREFERLLQIWRADLGGAG